MNKEFRYTEAFSYGYVFLAAVGLAAIGYGATQTFAIALGSMKLVSSPTSNVITVAAGVLFVVWGLHSVLSARAFTLPIHVGDEKIVVPVVKMYKAQPLEMAYVAVTELWFKNDDEEGKSIVLVTERDRVELFAENFADEKSFLELNEVLEAKCTAITNRK